MCVFACTGICLHVCMLCVCACVCVQVSVWYVCVCVCVIGCAFKVVPQYLSEESETHLFMCRLRVDGAWFPSQHIQLTARWWSHQDY